MLVERNSNIEALRIVAMFMVLALHVNFMSIGEPTTAEAIIEPFPTFLRVFFQQFANIAVDLFVLISGWYGIKCSVRGVAKFLFQSVFIITFMYVLGLLMGYAALEPKQILECLLLESNAWFVKCYLALFILSPVLNIYCQNTTERQQRNLLIGFYVFQTVFGAFTMSASFIKAGFSTFSFVGLYLLARYMRVYGQRIWIYSKWIYVISIIGSVLWFYLPLRFGVMRLAYMSILYTSPFCITGDLGLVMWIANMPPKRNRYVNFLAVSCFAVFLCHACNVWTVKEFVALAKQIYDLYSGLFYIIVIVAYMTIVFGLSIAIDQLRKYAWSFLDKCTHL